jgi:hypothetical protein
MNPPSPGRRLRRLLSALETLTDAEVAAAGAGDWARVNSTQQRTGPLLAALQETLAGQEIAPDLKSRFLSLRRRKAGLLDLLDRGLAEVGSRRLAVELSVSRLAGMRRAYATKPAPVAGYRRSA